MSSWKQKMKDPDFHNKYDLNTNPAQGATYIPKRTKVVSTNANNPNRFKDPTKKQGWTSVGKIHEIVEDGGFYSEEENPQFTGLDAIAVEVMNKYDLPEDHWGYFHIVKDALKEMYNKGIKSCQI